MSQQEKIFYIMRGLPGSGKSFKAKELGKNGIILSTDDFFMQNNEYKFDGNKIGQAHQWNQDRALKNAQNGVSPIVIDNTNTTRREIENYVSIAKKFGYKIRIEEPETEWKFNVDELEKRNTHKVPRGAIEKMLNRYDKTIKNEDYE